MSAVNQFIITNGIVLIFTVNKMPSKYHRTSTRTSITEAVRAMLGGTMGFKRTADSHGVCMKRK